MWCVYFFIFPNIYSYIYDYYHTSMIIIITTKVIINYSISQWWLKYLKIYSANEHSQLWFYVHQFFMTKIPAKPLTIANFLNVEFFFFNEKFSQAWQFFSKKIIRYIYLSIAKLLHSFYILYIGKKTNK